jgi:hypothetical protein
MKVKRMGRDPISEWIPAVHRIRQGDDRNALFQQPAGNILSGKSVRPRHGMNPFCMHTHPPYKIVALISEYIFYLYRRR